MVSVRLYTIALALLPFILWAWVLADPWPAIGFLCRLQRRNRQLYAKYRAWRHTQKAFKILWSEYARHDPYKRKTFKSLKRDKWDDLYQKSFKRYLAEDEKNKHPLELEYEQRQHGM